METYIEDSGLLNAKFKTTMVKVFIIYTNNISREHQKTSQPVGTKPRIIKVPGCTVSPTDFHSFHSTENG